MNMIKKTRQKFMLITLSAISVVLIIILSFLNMSVIAGIYYEAKTNIEVIREKRGFIFSGNAAHNPNSILGSISDAGSKVSYIYVRMPKNGTASPFMTTNMSDTYSPDDICEMAQLLESGVDDEGLYQNMMYEITRNDLSTTVVFVDVSNDIGTVVTLLKLSVVVIAFSLILVYIFTYRLSKWAIKPVQTAFDNQKRFISDASHELKTPLTVMSANADVLESEIGENQWLDNIKNQTTVMSQLVYDLLDLAKLDETRDDMVMAEFDLSSAVLSRTLEFECTAFEEHKKFEQNIKENIIYKGNEDSIKQLIGILVDNAIKHSEENGIIRVTLTTNGNKKIFQVYNTGNGIRDSEKDKIFNRFYRSDVSRSRETGGYGLGLSIAKSIAEAHGGTISVDGEENKWISFTVVL